jgi:hypothetical protein
MKEWLTVMRGFRRIIGHLRLGLPALSAVGMFAGSVGAETEHRPLVAADQCEPVFVAHLRNCVMQRILACDHAGETIFRNESIASSGLYHIEFADRDGNALSTWNASGENMWYSMIEARDRFSIVEVLEGGSDAFEIDYWTHHPLFADPLPETFSGTVRDTGEEFAVGDIRLKVLALDAVSQMNAYEHVTRREYYYEPASGALLWGTSLVEGAGGTEPVNYRPVEIIYPVDPMFQSDQPQYDCEAISSIAAPNSLSAKG